MHDLGNIIKFDMDKYPELMGVERKRIEYWKKVQTEIVEKYETVDYKETEKMLKELGTEKDIVKLILVKSFGDSIKIVVSNN